MREWQRTVFITLAYIGVGCVFYISVEEKPCESEERLSASDYDEKACAEAWTLVDALYFSMVTMSTVGYGDLTPTSAGSRLFTCLYIIIGITVVFVNIANALGGVLESTEQQFLRFLEKRWDKHANLAGSEAGLGGDAIDLTGDGKADFVAPPSNKVYWSQSLFCPFVVLVLIQIVSAIIFVQLEPDVQFDDAMYHCFVTATTVGYGDVSLTRQQSRLWAFFHIALSVAWLGAFISRVGELQETRTSQIQRYQLLLRRMDEDLICSLDHDGSGVDRLEFVVGMLIKLGAQMCGSPLDWSDVQPFVQRFDAFDLDKSGRLTKDDLLQMVQKEKKQLRKSLSQLSPSKQEAVAADLAEAQSVALKRSLSKIDQTEDGVSKSFCDNSRIDVVDLQKQMQRNHEELMSTLERLVSTDRRLPNGTSYGKKNEHEGNSVTSVPMGASPLFSVRDIDTREKTLSQLGLQQRGNAVYRADRSQVIASNGESKRENMATSLKRKKEDAISLDDMDTFWKQRGENATLSSQVMAASDQNPCENVATLFFHDNLQKADHPIPTYAAVV